MIRVKTSGRLGNILFQNIGVSILARKFDYKTEIINQYALTENDKNILGLKLYSGNNIKSDLKKIGDDNVLDILKLDKIDYGLDFEGYFELKDFVIDYKKDIIEHFSLKYDYISNDEVFVHVRLGDIYYYHKLAKLEYYIKALDSITFTKGYISSDTIDHPFVLELVKRYNLIIYNDSPVNTINFAKNFNNLVLSQGTFSWFIGFLSKANNILYPNNYNRWHGDIFVYDEWQGISV